MFPKRQGKKKANKCSSFFSHSRDSLVNYCVLLVVRKILACFCCMCCKIYCQHFRAHCKFPPPLSSMKQKLIDCSSSLTKWSVFCLSLLFIYSWIVFSDCWASAVLQLFTMGNLNRQFVSIQNSICTIWGCWPVGRVISSTLLLTIQDSFEHIFHILT